MDSEEPEIELPFLLCIAQGTAAVCGTQERKTEIQGGAFAAARSTDTHAEVQSVTSTRAPGAHRDDPQLVENDEDDEPFDQLACYVLPECAAGGRGQSRAVRPEQS